MAVTISLEKLVESGAHFGHQLRRWNPRMREYMHGTEGGVFVFDLVKTGELLGEALTEITNAVREGKAILLVGTKKQAKERVKEIGKETGILYVNSRWLGGTFTNFNQVARSIEKLRGFKKGLQDGSFADRTKKERLLISRDVEKLEESIGGLSEMKSLPYMMVVIDTHRERGAVKEAQRMGVKTVGVVDSNADPSEVDFPIPMNDDAARAVHYVLELIKEAIMEGKNIKPAKAEKKETKTKKTAVKTVKKTETK